MTDRLEEALAALRGDTAPESSGEATLERIRRSLAASDDASERALEAAFAADVEVIHSEGDRLLDLAVGALREPAGEEVDGAATLARIHRSLASREDAARLEAHERGEGLVDLAAAEWREQSARDEGAHRGTQTRVLATLDARRARARWALAAAAALALVVVPPTAWAWSTGRIEQWITSIAAPSATEQTSAPRGPEARAPRPRAAAPRVLPVEEHAPQSHDAVAQEASVVLASSDEPRDDRAAPEDVREQPASPRPVSAPTPRRPARRGDVSVVASAEPTTADAPQEAQRADPPVVAAAEPPVRAEEPALPSPEASTPPADAQERELFARAHRLHFGGGAHPAALAAWDDYLSAYPRGRYAPEARYNRALTLVRLGRIEEARRVLARFAAAPAGAYRRDEARALVDALGANATSE